MKSIQFCCDKLAVNYTLLSNSTYFIHLTLFLGLEVNADKTKYMVVSREQRAGRNHSVKIDSNSFEGVEEFKYLGTTLMNQNCIQVEIKSRLKLGNACYHSVHLRIP